MSQVETTATLKPWHIAASAAVIWTVAFLAWSWFLLLSSFDIFENDQLAQRTQVLQAILVEHLPPPAPDASGAFDSWTVEPTVAGGITQQFLRDPSLSYVVLWLPDGKVAGIWQASRGGPTLREHPFFAPAEWPTPEPPSATRISRINSFPWDLKGGPVTDVTLPFRWGNAFSGYLSAGYSQAASAQHFYQFAAPLLIRSTWATAGGIVVIVATVMLTARAFTKARAVQEQTLRAHTSLLTERGMLASVLAHEVRSPLTALRFTLHSLRNLIANNPADRQRQIDLADSCEREIRRLDLMLTEFLTHTQIVGVHDSTPVNQVIQEAVDFLRPSLERANIRIILHLSQSEPRVNANPDELRQVLLNLATNAQDAMPAGGTLAISTITPEDPADLNITLLVRDSGVGIPPEVQERLFEPFFSTKPRGSGLGLALVRRVISGAGGKIFVESAPKEGATFRLVLPRAVETVAPISTDRDETVDIPV